MSTDNTPLLIADFLEDLRLENDAPENTLWAYESDLGQFEGFLAAEGLVPLLDGRADLRAADRLCVRAFIAHRSSSDAKSTLQRKLSAIRRFYRYLRQRGLISKNPARLVPYPKKDEPLPRFLTPREADDLLKADKGALAKRDLALLELLYSTGARVSELTGANREDMNLEVGIVKVRGKGGKERLVMVGEAAKSALDAYFRESASERGKLFGGCEAGPLFLTRSGGRLSRQSAYHIARRYGLRSVMGKRVTPHALRHSFATHMLEGGANLREVQELLGHASLSATQIYTHLSVEHIRDVYEKAHPHGRKSRKGRAQN